MADNESEENELLTAVFNTLYDKAKDINSKNANIDKRDFHHNLHQAFIEIISSFLSIPEETEIKNFKKLGESLFAFGTLMGMFFQRIRNEIDIDELKKEFVSSIQLILREREELREKQKELEKLLSSDSDSWKSYS